LKSGRHIAVGMIALATIACTDRDAELREEFQKASMALVDHRVPDSQKTVFGREGWLFTWGEVRYLRSGSYVGENALKANRHAPPEYADPVPAIVDFHRQLQERGIELYFIPVPVRPVIYPESVLGSEPFAQRETVPNLHPHLQELLSALQENGVRVFDVTPTFLDQREHPNHGPVFCQSDTHWTPYGIAMAAKILANEIQEKPWFEGVPKQKYNQRWITKKHTGLLYRNYEKASGTAREPEPVWIRKIMLETEEGLKNIELHHPKSPVILIGDSNSAFWSTFSSGLPHSLAFELGFPVDVLSAAGGGANTSRLNLARKIRAEPEYLEGKRAVIWCISARAFTNTGEGWIPIPL
jgi:hypothetical protein